MPCCVLLSAPAVSRTGALAELKTLGVSVDGYAPGAIAASTYKGKTYALQSPIDRVPVFARAGAPADLLAVFRP